MSKNTVIPNQSSQAAQTILQRMPKEIVDSFTEQQLSYLHAALGVRSWKKHSVDVRSTFGIPFTTTQIYYVFLIGKNRRDLSRREQQISAITTAVVVSFLIIICMMLGMLGLYLLKSALGIDLFEGFSLGIWAWFKSLF